MPMARVAGWGRRSIGTWWWFATLSGYAFDECLRFVSCRFKSLCASGFLFRPNAPFWFYLIFCLFVFNIVHGACHIPVAALRTVMVRCRRFVAEQSIVKQFDDKFCLEGEENISHTFDWPELILVIRVWDKCTSFNGFTGLYYHVRLLFSFFLAAK